ncbi:MAG TPA: S41 family peptidase [Gemmatimonadaceae bacterium]|nr:S41 family peptidase [Gemmatimonadaceae bacterium]
MRLSVLLLAFAASNVSAQSLGYYRQPSLSRDQIVFAAEGDLWTVGVAGGVAQRLTTHPAAESRPFISPDGRTLAFSAAYEGPNEVYTMELANPGPPVRRTFEGGNALVIGWTPRGEILYSTRRFSGLPNTQLALVDLKTQATRLIPLAQASDGVVDDAGNLFFTRLPFQGSYAKRYKGGTAQNIWRFASGQNTEATPMTADYAGTSRTPMVWNGRIYFASDRDGTMNLWSMTTDGRDARQHTRHAGGFDVLSPSLNNGRIVYQLGADIHLYDIASNVDRLVPIRLISDFDQLRERWIKNPTEWITDFHISPNGDRVVFTVRGQVFVLPVQQGAGRIVEALPNKSVRFRQAKFFPSGKDLLAVGDESGENEFWKLPANGIGQRDQLTNDATIMRWDGISSPDGRYVLHSDKLQRLFLTDVAAKQTKKILDSQTSDIYAARWSPDSKWLAYGVGADNGFGQIWLYEVATGKATALTSDRYDSDDPVWSPDGKWIYFLSNRFFQSLVGAPWGNRGPEPYFDKQTKLYQVSMRPGERSPFQPDDELSVTLAGDTSKKADNASATSVDLTGIQTRVMEVPIPNGNYRALEHDGKRLYLLTADASTPQGRSSLQTLEVTNKQPRLETFMEDIRSFELSADRKKVLVRRANDFYVLDAAAKAPTDLSKAKVDLASWQIRFDPRDEWRQMFVDAWRLHRDWFYDANMHGVDWKAMRARYEPLVSRVTDRGELSDLISQMIGELSALHASVGGGDIRGGRDTVAVASLGATFEKVQGGFRVAHVYASDPDIPNELSPLAQPNVNVRVGDVIESVNGAPVSSAADIGQLLRGQVDRQVLLGVRGSSGSRQIVVVPVSQARDFDLRYDEWEYSRRLVVEQQSNRKIGYVHLRAMGTNNIAEWAREFYPVFDREGLIIDVRNNNGGNIDSWILGRLLRKAWMYWQPRVGQPYWNMQSAFRGHMVVLANEWTASDGEAFAEGFRRLGMGKVIGTRTWGGEIWLSGSNAMVDRGIATAAENGVYGPEGAWLIEGHGVDPDVAVDNPPFATFRGEDKQLDAAIAYLKEEIRKKPVPVPAAPKYPDKAFKAGVIQAGKP